MDLKARLKQGLEHSGGFTAAIVNEIPVGEQWVLRPTPNANHTLWIVGHLGTATNSFIGLVDPSQRDQREDFPALFGKGSQPKSELDAYPAVDEVMGYWSARSKAFIQLLDECSEADLQREVPKGPGFMHDVAAVFHMAAWHETLHAGQLTIIHRLIGQSPLADR